MTGRHRDTVSRSAHPCCIRTSGEGGERQPGPLSRLRSSSLVTSATSYIRLYSRLSECEARIHPIELRLAAGDHLHGRLDVDRRLPCLPKLLVRYQAFFLVLGERRRALADVQQTLFQDRDENRRDRRNERRREPHGDTGRSAL